MRPTSDIDPLALARLGRELRVLKLYAVGLTAALLALAAWTVFVPRKELALERLDIVDASGTARLVIANGARFPQPKIGGKSFARAVTPAGIVFYDARGSEVGGLAVTDAAQGKIAALAFDYPNYDAIGLVTRIDADGSAASSGLHINARAPAALGPPEAARLVKQRLAIENDNEDARIVLADPQGRERIRLVVDRTGDTRIEMLDEQGKPRWRVPAPP